jgi:magnesium-protoporphyrin IX monomethyl ester (oxidative) cyclase
LANLFSGRAWQRFLMMAFITPTAWCRFFLLSVFATMYLNDVQRADFYASLGLDAREYDKSVIEKTNETAGRVFPVILDVDHPEFYDRLETCVQNNEKLTEIANSSAPAPVKLLQKLPLYLDNAWQLIQLYRIQPRNIQELVPAVL